MKSICLYFHIHQPFMFRRYRFFDIDNEHYYYDDHWNETATKKLVSNYYLPTTQLLISLIKKNSDKIKISLSVSGVALKLFEIYAPEMIEELQKFVKTESVELIGETYSNALASFKNDDAFKQQINLQNDILKKLFNQQPIVCKNTKMFYSDEVGKNLSEYGFKGVLTTGASFSENIQSPNHLFVNALNKRFKVLIDDEKMNSYFLENLSKESGDKAIKNYVEKNYSEESLINLSLDYKFFSSMIIENDLFKQNFESVIDSFVGDESLSLIHPSEALTEFQPYSSVSFKKPIGYIKNYTEVGNLSFSEVQNEAIAKLYELQTQMEQCHDQSLITDWLNLQSSDHFFYMSKEFYDSQHDVIFSKPYDSPYEAFINFMNILSDFKIRLNKEVPIERNKQEVQSLQNQLQEKEKEIEELKEKLRNLQK